MKYLVLLLLSLPLLAGEFETYEWKTTFRVGPNFYQPQLHIAYEFEGEAKEHPEVLAFPHSANLNLLELTFKVDGKKVEKERKQMVTYWSQGRPVSVWVPSVSPQNRVEAKASYAIKNLFLIPPAPVSFPVAANVRISFEPLPDFTLTGMFVGKTRKFKRRRIAHKPGEPAFSHMAKFKVKPNRDAQELFFLIPQQFDYQLQASLDERMKRREAVLSSSGDETRPYTAHFYKGDAKRDWSLAPTWIQQKRTNLPFGIIPGGTSENFKLFKGAGMKEDQGIPWIKSELGKGSNEIAEGMTVLARIDQSLPKLRAEMSINPEWGRLLALEKDGTVSMAMANKILANHLVETHGVEAVPAFASKLPADMAPHLPLSAFDRVLTGIHVGKHWFFVDAADPNWFLHNAREFLRGYTIVLLSGEDLVGLTF